MYMCVCLVDLTNGQESDLRLQYPFKASVVQTAALLSFSSKSLYVETN